MEQRIKIIRSESKLLKLGEDILNCDRQKPTIINTAKRSRIASELLREIKETHGKVTGQYEKLSEELNQTILQKQHRDNIQTRIKENRVFKQIDLFYRPVFNVYEPFNRDVYKYELYRLFLREQHAERIFEEIKEDKERLEEYRRVTKSIEYKKLPLKKPECKTQTSPNAVCKDRTSPNAVSSVNVDILSNLIC